FDPGRIGEPRPQQFAFAVVVTDYDRFARGDALFSERHDEGTELRIGVVKAGLVEVTYMAARGAGPHDKPHPLLARPRQPGHRFPAVRNVLLPLWRYSAGEDPGRLPRTAARKPARTPGVSAPVARAEVGADHRASDPLGRRLREMS